MSTLSIVTVAYESADKLPSFLASARHIAPAAQQIVVDNASTDATRDIAHEHGAHRVLNAGANLGFGRACNLGADAADGEWLLFANPDLTIECLPALPSKSGRPFGLAGGALCEGGGEYRPSLRAELRLPEEAAMQLLYRLIPSGSARFAPQRRRPARWASGALLLCRRDEFLRVGGFDPRFFLYFEDRDLSNRYRLSGYPLHCDPHLRGNHGHGQSSPNVNAWQREAWSLVSWIEYRGIWHGLSSARHTARLTLSTLSSIRWLGERVRDARGVRKSAEAAKIYAFLCNLDEHLVSSPACHPMARAALSDALAEN